MERFYCFAGLELAISTQIEWITHGDTCLETFRVDSVTDPHRYFFTVVDELSPPEGQLVATMGNFFIYWSDDVRIRYIGAGMKEWFDGHTRVMHQGKHHFVELKKSSYPNGMRTKTVLNVLEAEHLLAENNGFIFHSSFVDVDGHGILFTAPSGTGKSTQADLWKQFRGARIINGDRSAVRCIEEEILACGIPFMGSSEYCMNEMLPLSCVVYLAQSSQTTIRRLKGLEAFRRVWEGASVNTWDRKDMSLVMDTVCYLVENVPVWYLECTPDESAIIALEQQMKGRYT